MIPTYLKASKKREKRITCDSKAQLQRLCQSFQYIWWQTKMSLVLVMRKQKDQQVQLSNLHLVVLGKSHLRRPVPLPRSMGLFTLRCRPKLIHRTTSLFSKSICNTYLILWGEKWAWGRHLAWGACKTSKAWHRSRKPLKEPSAALNDFYTRKYYILIHLQFHIKFFNYF